MTLQAFPPNHRMLRYSGHVDVEATVERVRFTRDYMPWSRHPLSFAQSPGATVSWRQNAAVRRVFVDLEYQHECSEECALVELAILVLEEAGNSTDDEQVCHKPRRCRCQCRPKAFVDGQRAPLDFAVNHTAFRTGEIFRAELALGGARQTGHRDVRVVWPWCAAIDFRGLVVESDSGASALEEQLPAAPPRYVAFGDSITQGWCASDSYPDLLGRWNGWEAINLGVQGLAVGSDARDVGRAIGAQRGDVVSVLVGANNCLSCTTCGRFKVDVTALLRGLREVQPLVPIALITPPAGYDDCPMDSVRARLREAVRDVRDERLLLLEGLQLMPPEGRIEASNPHPSTAGMREFAANLNAELGFSVLRVRLVGCDAGARPRLLVRGLTPGGSFGIFVGSAAVPTSKRRSWLVSRGTDGPIGPRAHASCPHRSLMIVPLSHVYGTADSGGGSQVLLEHADCERSNWQVMDFGSCSTSAVNDARGRNFTSQLVVDDATAAGAAETAPTVK